MAMSPTEGAIDPDQDDEILVHDHLIDQSCDGNDQILDRKNACKFIYIYTIYIEE